ATEHHVGGLEIAVQHAALVDVVDGQAHARERVQQASPAVLGGQLGVAASQPGDDLVERATEDLLHREVHAAVGRIADVVDRHDRGVLEAALDPRLANEACAGAGPAGPRATD